MNAVIYARYSSAGQTEQSIEGQLRVCREFAEHNGYNIIAEYIDRAISGTTDNRPGFLKMIDDAAKQEFGAILVYKLDRFARNKYDSVIYKHKLKEINVRVVSATEAISDTPEGKLVEGLLEMMAEMYSTDLSQKVKRGLKESTIKGTFTGGKVLYGYHIENKKVLIDEQKAEVVRIMFREYAAGTSKVEIVHILNEKGFLSYRNKQFSINSFQNTLSNKKYIGINEYSGIVNENTYPAIIEKELFDNVQKRLKQTARAPAAHKAKVDYVLSGKLFCGHCGTAMVGVSGTSKTKGKRHYYYTCGNRWREHNCNKANERKDDLEKQVVLQIKTNLKKQVVLEEIADGIVAFYDKNPIEAQIKDYQKRITAIDYKMDKAFKVALNSNSDAMIKRVDEQVATYEIEKADLQKELKKLKLSAGIQKDKETIILQIKRLANPKVNPNTYLKRMIDTFINSIWVYDDRLIVYFDLFGTQTITHGEVQTNIDAALQGHFNGVRISSATDRHEPNVRR